MMLSEYSKPFKTINNPNITNPMDLTTIQKNLAERTYKTAPEFAADFRLILTNTLQNYPVEHEVIKMSRQINKLFDEQYFTHFSLGYENGELQDGGNSPSAKHCPTEEDPEKTVQKQEKKVKEFKCQKCDTKFGTSYNLKRHELAHHDKKKLFPCKFCDKSFSQKANMSRHEISVHHESK